MPDLNSSTTMLLNSGIGLAILGYFGYLLKGVPGQLYFYISKYITRSMQATTDDYTAYSHTVAWARKNFPSLKRHIQLTGATEDEEMEEHLADGTYYCFKDKTLCVIEKRKVENRNRISMEITLTAVGLHEKEIVESCQAYVKDNMPSREEYIRVYTTPNYVENYDNYLIKKSLDATYSPIAREIRSILDNFIASKDKYIKKGQPYKTGILLYGEPGTGKSTMAKAIASYLGWDLQYVNSIKKVGAARVPAKTVLLFEDLDCLISTRRQAPIFALDDSGAVTEMPASNKGSASADSFMKENIHSLLNFLDGTMSPENVIFVATTNYIDRLDPAILRPGRFDHVIELGRIDKDMAKKACDNWEVGYDKLDGLEFPATIAQVMNQIKK